MNLKFYIFGIIFTAAIGLFSFFSLIRFFSPEDADTLLLALLFLSLFIGLASLFCLIGFVARRKKFLRQEVAGLFNISFRQGALLSLLLTGSLILRAYMNLWLVSSLILLLMVLGAEILFLKKQQ